MKLRRKSKIKEFIRKIKRKEERVEPMVKINDLQNALEESIIRINELQLGTHR